MVSDSGPASRTPTSGEPTTDDLLDAAILTAAEEELTLLGIRRSSVEEMARKAGVSRSTFYRRYRSKEDLIIAVANHVAGESIRELEAAVAGRGPEDAVVEAFCVSVRTFTTRKIFRRLLAGEAALPLVKYLRRNLLDTVVAHLAALLKDAGSPRSDEELLIASELLVRSVMSYLEIPSRLVPFDDPVLVRRFARDNLALLVAGPRAATDTEVAR